MCGIAGIIQRDGRPVDAAPIRRMGDLLRHRGPDDAGYACWNTGGFADVMNEFGDTKASAAIAHRRLSIIDLSTHARQPMRSANGKWIVAFNGEIYNHIELRAELERDGVAFRTHSDTEVLVEAWSRWGRRALTRLVGMFAFAIIDVTRGRLTLVRDFFGIKPLYVSIVGSRVSFASEIPPLLALDDSRPKADAQRLFDYLRFGLTDHGQGTMFEAIRQLPPASLWECDLRGDGVPRFEPETYWSLPSERIDISPDAAAARLCDLFTESVRLHLRSDVPIGAALSGGVDSSAIACVARRLLGERHELHAFSYVARNTPVDEERWIDISAKASGATVHKITLEPNDLVERLPALIEAQAEPFGSTSILAQFAVFERASRMGIKVMLDGQGADELMAGYPPMSAALISGWLRRGRIGAANRLAASIAARSGISRRESLQRAISFLLPESWQEIPRRAVGRRLTPEWLNEKWFRAREVVPRPQWNHSRRSGEMLRDHLRQAVSTTSLPMLLRYEDRDSMAFSIESRVPFLTPAIAEFAMSLPEDQLLAADGTTKAVLRRAMRGVVPDAILDRKDKVGFATPQAQWMTQMNAWVDRRLSGEILESIPALVPSRVREALRTTRERNQEMPPHLWRWINLACWAERFRVAF